MTYEEYKKQRLAQNNTQSNVSNTTEINTAPVNKYEEYKKQRLAQQQEHLKTLKKETKQAQLAKDFISQNGTEKINSEYNNYMQSMNKAIAPKLYQTEEMQELASKRNATTPLEVSVYAKGNPVTQSILKLQNFAKENGIEIDVNDPVTSLTNQTNKLDDAKKEELMKYIYTYNKVRQEDLKNKNYIGNRAVSGLVSSISGAIDAGLGFLAENPLNRAMRSKNELYANIQKKAVNEDSPLYQPLNQMADKTLQKVEEERDKVTARANKLKEYNILGTTAEALKKEQQGIEETQNISSLKKFTGDITEGITGMAPTILLSAYTQNPQLGLNVMSTSAGGNAYREALNEGQSSDNAIAYGTLMGLKEYATEKMFGAMNRMAGFDVKGYGDELSESIINQIFKENSNKILRGFAEYTLGGAEEGLEEFVGDLVEPYIKNLTLGTKEKADLKSALYSGLVGAMTGLAMGAPGGAINLANDIKTNQSTTQNNTQLPQNTQNTSNNVQNVANSEQISQNNVQNVSDLEKNQQMSISDEQNSQATVTNEIQTFVENRNKIAPGLNVEMDNTLKTDGVIIKNSDGTRTMKINPNSTRAYEFVAVHEMLHDLEGTQEYSELQKYVQDRATSHENYEQAKQKITEQYENFYKENNLDISKLDMNVETVNDMVAQSLGNQQFLNELAGNKPNVFMKMYNWVKNVLFDGQNTGKTFNERRTDNKHLQELKKKFEVAYNTAYNGNASQQYSIQTDTNGNKYVKVDTDQDIFKNIDKKDYNKIAKMYIQDYLMGKTKLSNNDTTVIDRKSANKYTNPGKKQQNFNEKMQLTPELKNVLEIAQKDSTSRPLKSNSKYKNWEYYKVKFEINGKMFEGLINIGLDSNNNKHFYEINKIRETDDISRTSLNSSSTSLFKYSIPSSDGTVNNQYMQNNEKNSQGLENSSSFSLSKDNQGRTLSKEQQEYFKDSKVRDENGNLLVVYHGTQNGGFTEFHGYSYFTDSPDTARSYSGGIENITKYTFESGQRTTTGNYKGYLNLINPYIIDLKGAEWGEINIDSLNIPEIQQWINEVGVSTWNDNGKTFISTDDIVSIVDAMNDSGKNYDGIILKNIRDNGMRANTNDNISTDYVAFKGKEQFKSIDNTKPTSNPDIRYSQSNNEWSKYLKENWDLMPNSKKTFGFPTNEQLQAMDNKKISESADVLNLKEKKIKSLEDIANMTENDAKMENGVNYKHKKDKNTSYQRKFFENVKTSKIINQEVKETIEMTTYERQANEQTLEKAKNSLDEQGDKLIKQWERKTKNFTAEDVAIGAILIERYQQQGDNESAVNVVQKLADMGTEAGRAVQMFSIFQRLTPEAMLIYQQRKLNDVFKEVSQRKTGEWVEANRDKFQLTSEDGKFITEQVEKAQQATSEREKQIELAKIEKRINDKLPPERGQTIKAIRRMAMLFNPKTQVRNIVGNTLIMPVNDVADIIGTQIDKAIAKRTGVRTTNNPIFKEKGKGFKKGITESIQDYKMGIRTEPSGSKYEFNFGGKSFNENTTSKALNAINNKLNGIENLLGAVMSGGDRPFYEAAFNNSLQGQMKANNVTTPTTEMIDIAVNEALSRTWNDSNSYTEAVLGIRRQMNKLNIGGFGLGDLIIPFAKTPANLTKAMVEYSPLGTIEAIINYSDMKKAISRGEMTAQQQKNFVNSTSKAITGSILYLIAGALAQSGAVTGSADDDKDIKNFEQNVLGIQPYSIKIGDKTFTYSWANPLNAPLAIMADTYKMGKEKAGLFDILTNGFKVAGEVVVDNSFLQGIKELFEADSISEGVVNAIVDMPAQFIPTFLSQFATLGDKSKRQTFEYGDKLKSTINQIKAKIPGAKNTLAPTVNTFGEEVENYGGDNSAFNVFLNPANISKANATDTQKELYALYEATKDKTIFPMQAPYYLSDDGEKVNLSSNERSEYQKRSGEYVSKELHALFDSEFYKTLESEDKVEVVNKIVKDANTHAKSKWITTKATKELKKIQEELKDVPMVDYYNAWLAQKDAEGKKNAKGETISGTKKKAKIKAINSAVDDDLTTYQKKALYRIFNVD